jgi:hypothetical protein
MKILPISFAAIVIFGCSASWAEEVHLNYGTIKQEYKEQKPDGTARDPQSGLPTGQRLHKPLTTTVSPALQGNKLGGGSTGPTVPPKPTLGNTNR